MRALIALGLALVALTLAGCAGSSSAPATVTVTTQAKAPVQAPTRVSTGDLRRALKQYGVTSHVVRVASAPCPAPVFLSKSATKDYAAYLVVSTSTRCDQYLAAFPGIDDHVLKNVWVAHTTRAKLAGAEVRAMALAAMLQYLG